MLFAAKVVENKNLSNGFIRHAIDEYKHCSIFTNIKKQMISEYKINDKELTFVPNHIYNKGYIYKDHFIFEKKKLIDFAIFIGANEKIAEKKLIAFSNHLKNHRPLAFKEIQKILKDEEKHAEYSLKFAKKNNGFFLYNFKLAKEKKISFLRHIYANSLNKFSIIFNPILLIILILISFVTYFLKLKKKIIDNDVIKNIEPSSII
ncbi:hypothetical protein IDH27_03535 [Pelagibacterales bacterium SAG-MED46]|nr:hypothetical protein [Pelagibacterales bacterium SAG-MED46]